MENHVYPSQLEATITTVSKLDAKVNKLTQKGSSGSTLGSASGTQPRSLRFKMPTQASSQADGPLISKNDHDLGCEAGQTIVHAPPAQPMEVDRSSVSSCAVLPAIQVPVNDHSFHKSRGGLPRASQRLQDLTSHGLTRGTLQIRPSSKEMCGAIGSVQWLWVAQAL